MNETTGPVPFRPLDCFRGDEVEPHVLELGRRLLAARELDQLRDQVGHLAELLDDVGEQALALTGRKLAVAGEHFDVRPQARQRRAELVRGVGDELPAGSRRLLECAEHRVEARRKAADLVPATGIDPPGEVARDGDLLSRLGQSAHRDERRPRDHEPEPRRHEDPSGGDQDQEQLDLVERVVGFLERARDLDREARDRRVLERDHADARPVGACVREEGAPLATCNCDRTLVHRKREVLARTPNDLSVRAHDLGVPAEDARLRRSLPDLEGWAGLDSLLAVLQRVVDARVELVADDDVDDARGSDDCESDRGGGHQRQPGAKTHDSRSA